MGSTVDGNEQAAAAGRTLDEVEAELSGAVAEMRALKEERDALHERITSATKEQDAAQLEELAGPFLSLRTQIAAAQARLWRLYAERARLQLPAAEAAAAAARAAFDEAYAQYLEAHERTNRLGVEADNARVRALSLRQTMEENERKAQAAGRRLPARQS